MKYRTKLHLAIFLIVPCMFFGSSCANWSKTAKGGTVGAGVGATVGGAVGSRSNNTAKGAILGAAVGGVAGAAIGRYMDRQQRQLERELGRNAEIERVGEGIQVTFNSGLLFDINSAEMRAASRENIRKMCEVLQEYPDTEILIEGHTDSTGSSDHNQGLSERRAQSVANYVRSQGIPSNRLTIRGYGQNQPIADNATDAGRQKNRRVEVAIYANDELKEKAQKGQI